MNRLLFEPLCSPHQMPQRMPHRGRFRLKKPINMREHQLVSDLIGEQIILACNEHKNIFLKKHSNSKVEANLYTLTIEAMAFIAIESDQALSAFFDAYCIEKDIISDCEWRLIPEPDHKKWQPIYWL